MSHFFMTPSRRAKRVLIVNPFGIGDALFVTPVIRALKEHGVEEIDLLLGSRTREIFELHPFVARIFEWDKSRITWGQLIRLFWNLRRRRYDAMIDVSMGRQYAFLGWVLFGIPLRAGFNFKNRGTFLTHKLDIPNAYEEKPVVEYYRDLLGLISVRNMSPELEFWISEEDRSNARRILESAGVLKEPFLAVAPGGGESWGKDARLKQWPLEHFEGFVRLMAKEYGGLFRSIVILGGKQDCVLGKKLSEQLSDFRIYNFCAMMPLRISAAVIERAALLLANDSGLVHMARAVRIPLIALYGPVPPKVYGPYPPHPLAEAVTNEGPECRPCYYRMRYQAECKGIECLTTLTPQFVFQTLKARGFFERLNHSINAHEHRF